MVSAILDASVVRLRLEEDASEGNNSDKVKDWRTGTRADVPPVVRLHEVLVHTPEGRGRCGHGRHDGQKL